MTGGPSPWQDVPLEQLHRGLHDPATCKVCGPVQASPAWARGVERANRHRGVLPLTSNEREAGSGREVYE